jgi:hypothetical protein
MSEHKWVTEEVEVPSNLGGGTEEFWICNQCGASAGPKFPDGEKRWAPFYADGSGLKLTDDCDESRALIAKHKET